MQNGKVGNQELAALGTPPAPVKPSGIGRTIWEFWKAYAERVALYQTLVILSVIYILIVGPIAAIGRLTGHQFLPLRVTNPTTLWQPAHMGRIASLDELKKQG
jgi:hypothetical protein